MDFLDWLEYYADKTYGLEDDDFFSYGEIAGYLPGTEPAGLIIKYIQGFKTENIFSVFFK